MLGQWFDEQLPCAGISSAVGALAGKSPEGPKHFPAPKTVGGSSPMGCQALLQMGQGRGEVTASCSAGEALTTENKLASQPCCADTAKCFFFFFSCFFFVWFFMLCLCRLFWACSVPRHPHAKLGLCHGNMQRRWWARSGSGLLVLPGSRSTAIMPGSVPINPRLPLPLQ